MTGFLRVVVVIITGLVNGLAGQHPGGISCIWVYRPCLVGDRYPILNNCKTFSECILHRRRGPILQIRSCPSYHVFDHRQMLCRHIHGDAWRLCASRDRRLCEDLQVPTTERISRVTATPITDTFTRKKDEDSREKSKQSHESDSDPDDCIIVSVPCKVGDKYPVTGKCNSYSKCEQRGQKVRLKTKSCGSRIYDHEDEKCVDASSEKRQEICYAPDRQFCANTTTTASSTATSTATTSTTSTMMSTKYTTAPSRTDRTDDVSTTSNQSGTTTEEPPPDDQQTTGTSSNSVLKNPTVLATIIAVAGVIVLSAIIAITVICIRRRKQGGSDTGFPRKTLIQSISTNTEEAIYSEIAEVPPVPPPRPNLTPTSSAASEGQPILRTNSLYDAPEGMSNPNYHPAYIEVLPSAPDEPGNEGIDNEAYNYTYPRNPVSVLEALRGQEAPPTGDNDSSPTGGADAVSL